MENKGNKTPFQQRHPKLYILFSFLFLALLIFGATCIVIGVIELLKDAILKLVTFLSALNSKLDAVVIVALITGGVSIVGVIMSSIVSKIIDYKTNRREYLAQKREKPYGEFVDMVYKVQQNSKKPNSYTEKEMQEDLMKFSKEITLWGSKKVVDKWVEFKDNGTKPEASTDNLFVMESILNAMRKDLGLKKTKKGNLLSFFINDIKDFVNPKSKKK